MPSSLAQSDIHSVNFIGRSKILASLHRTLNHRDYSDTPQSVILFGQAGIGKTEIALEYVRRRRQEYTSIFRIDARSQDTVKMGLVRSFFELLHRYPDFGLHDASIYENLGQVKEQILHQNPKPSHKQMIDIFIQWLELPENKHWLLLYDNYDDVEAYDLLRFFPKAVHGSIIVTSRRQESVRLGYGIEVTDMTEEEALKFLSNCGRLSTQAEPNAARMLLQRLGNIPLAIEHAGAYISTRSGKIQQYLARYERDMDLLFKDVPALWDYRHETVLTTWELSFQALRSSSPIAAEALLICGFFARTKLYFHDLFDHTMMTPSEGKQAKTHKLSANLNLYPI